MEAARSRGEGASPEEHGQAPGHRTRLPAPPASLLQEPFNSPLTRCDEHREMNSRQQARRNLRHPLTDVRVPTAWVESKPFVCLLPSRPSRTVGASGLLLSSPAVFYSAVIPLTFPIPQSFLGCAVCHQQPISFLQT